MDGWVEANKALKKLWLIDGCCIHEGCRDGAQTSQLSFPSFRGEKKVVGGCSAAPGVMSVEYL